MPLFILYLGRTVFAGGLGGTSVWRDGWDNHLLRSRCVRGSARLGELRRAVTACLRARLG